MIEYIREGNWDTTFIQKQIAMVPKVQVVPQMPESLSPSPAAANQMQYYLLRHGQSTANVAEIISSDRYTLSYTTKHGLTELGTQQATASAQQLVVQMMQQNQSTGSTENNDNPTSSRSSNRHHRLIFVSSPFARARQTALACLHGMQALIKNDENSEMQEKIEIIPSILIHNSLVERYFGIYDNDILETYGYVWPLDQINVTHTTYNVESVAAVATRIQSLILQMNQYIATTYHSNNNDKNHKIHEYDPDAITNHVVLVSHGDVVQIAQLYAANVTNVGEFSSYRFQSTLVMIALSLLWHVNFDNSRILLNSYFILSSPTFLSCIQMKTRW